MQHQATVLFKEIPYGELFTPELVETMARDYFDFPTFVSVIRVSKDWNNFFTPCYLEKIQRKICEMFPIDLPVLKNFTASYSLATNLKEIDILRLIYQQLLLLKKKFHLLPRFIQKFCFYNPDLILACCTDNPGCFFAVINDEHQFIFEKIATIVGYNKIAMIFLKLKKSYLPSLELEIIDSGNLNLLLEIQKLSETDTTWPNVDVAIARCAARSGDLERIKHIFESQNESLKEKLKNEWGASLIGNAAASGNFALLHYLLEEQQIEEEVTMQMLEEAALAGSLESVRYLQSELSPTLPTLISAARSGNLELVCYLLQEHADTIKMDDDNTNQEVSAEEIIKEIISKTPPLHILRYFLIDNPFHIVPNVTMLQAAVLSDQVESIRLLLSPILPLRKAMEENKEERDFLLHIAAGGYLHSLVYLIETFHLQVNANTFHRAIRSCDPLLIRYLLSTHAHLLTSLDPSVILDHPSYELLKHLSIKQLINLQALSVEQKCKFINNAIRSIEKTADVRLLYGIFDPSSGLLTSPYPCFPDTALLHCISQISNRGIPTFSNSKAHEMYMIKKVLSSATWSFTIFLQLASDDCSSFNKEETQQHLMNIYNYSPIHFKQVFSYICSSTFFPEKSKQFFLKHVEELTTNQNFTAKTRNQLKTLLSIVASQSQPNETNEEELRKEECSIRLGKN